MANPDPSITIPNIDTWPKDAVHPILDRIVKWHGAFHVTIKLLTGYQFPVQVVRDETVLDLKKRCAEQLILLPHQAFFNKDITKTVECLRFIFKGKALADDDRLSVALMEENTNHTVHVVYRIRGGANTPGPVLRRVNLKFLSRAVKFVPGELVSELKKRVSEHYWFMRRYGCVKEDGIELYFKGFCLSDETAVDATGARYIGDLIMRVVLMPYKKMVKKEVKKEDLPLGMRVDFRAVLERYSK